MGIIRFSSRVKIHDVKSINPGFEHSKHLLISYLLPLSKAPYISKGSGFMAMAVIKIFEFSIWKNYCTQLNPTIHHNTFTP